MARPSTPHIVYFSAFSQQLADSSGKLYRLPALLAADGISVELRVVWLEPSLALGDGMGGGWALIDGRFPPGAVVMDSHCL